MVSQSVRRGPSILQYGSAILPQYLLELVVGYVDGSDSDKLRELLADNVDKRLRIGDVIIVQHKTTTVLLIKKDRLGLLMMLRAIRDCEMNRNRSNI